MSESPWRATLGTRIRDARQERGWGWRAIGRRSSVPVTTWRRIELGHPANDHALLGIAETLGWDRGECFRIMADALDDD